MRFASRNAMTLNLNALFRLRHLQEERAWRSHLLTAFFVLSPLLLVGAGAFFSFVWPPVHMHWTVIGVLMVLIAVCNVFREDFDPWLPRPRVLQECFEQLPYVELTKSEYDTLAALLKTLCTKSPKDTRCVLTDLQEKHPALYRLSVVQELDRILPRHKQ